MEECILCNEAITNPICIDCVEFEIATWLSEVNPNLIDELKRKTDEINMSFGDNSCILCKNHMSVCTFCYRNHILDWLTNEHPEFSSEYRRYFSLNYFF